MVNRILICKLSFLLFFAFGIYFSTLAQLPTVFKGAFFTQVSKQNNLLFGGVPNTVFLERSIFGADSIRIETYDSLLTIKRDSGNWYTITPKVYQAVRHPSDAYDSLLTIYLNDINKFQDSSFQQLLNQAEKYVYTERLDKYSTSIWIHLLKRKDNKYVVQSRYYIPLEVIPINYDVFAFYGGKQSGERIPKKDFFTNPILSTFVHFRDEDQYVTPYIEDQYQVISFNVSWDDKDGDISDRAINGDRLTESVQRQMLANMGEESAVMFDNIKLKSKLTGRIRKAPSLIYFLTKS